jgi:hypothetical protein
MGFVEDNLHWSFHPRPLGAALKALFCFGTARSRDCGSLRHERGLQALLGPTVTFSDSCLRFMRAQPSDVLNISSDHVFYRCDDKSQLTYVRRVEYRGKPADNKTDIGTVPSMNREAVRRSILSAAKLTNLRI